MRRVFSAQAELRARQTDLGEPGADRRLTGDERRPARRAALLSVEVGEQRAFLGDPIDIRRAVSHDAEVVGAEVEPADVVGT